MIKFFKLSSGESIIGEEKENMITNVLEMKIVTFQDPKTKQIIKAPTTSPLNEPFNIQPLDISKKYIICELKMEENNTKIMIKHYKETLENLESPNIIKPKQKSEIIDNVNNLVIGNIKGV